ncbi:DUF4515 domain-containing protein [Caenorhabditis elegans]|uniref:DUF4515 domain-containing protein n=1 Tax=Caenorhabditis elegans TaxID=6239 RepID=Q9XUF1_CAEEL|nr:DUF4515 domain-containing protein [Caenorhabditis elegans]CAB05167.2 DUF4515 domain-containing protein [Caenorhabditis elegans]|eukprot:NP_503084.2 Uncharacterized protein CELE_C49C3.15 [Caenorhabditis elegans]
MPRRSVAMRKRIENLHKNKAAKNEQKDPKRKKVESPATSSTQQEQAPKSSATVAPKSASPRKIIARFKIDSRKLQMEVAKQSAAEAAAVDVASTSASSSDAQELTILREKLKLSEERNFSLETRLKMQEAAFHRKLQEVKNEQDADMKQKYTILENYSVMCKKNNLQLVAELKEAKCEIEKKTRECADLKMAAAFYKSSSKYASTITPQRKQVVSPGKDSSPSTSTAKVVKPAESPLAAAGKAINPRDILLF